MQTHYTALSSCVTRCISSLQTAGSACHQPGQCCAELSGGSETSTSISDDDDAQHAQQAAAGLSLMLSMHSRLAAGLDVNAQHAQQAAGGLDVNAQHAQQAAAALEANAFSTQGHSCGRMQHWLQVPG